MNYNLFVIIYNKSKVIFYKLFNSFQLINIDKLPVLNTYFYIITYFYLLFRLFSIHFFQNDYSEYVKSYFFEQRKIKMLFFLFCFQSI